jgi:hypothetical protein
VGSDANVELAVGDEERVGVLEGRRVAVLVAAGALVG